MKADDQQAIDFLKHLRPEGPWVLTAIIPDGATETITARDADDVRAFIRTHDGKRNIYYSVNPTRGEMSSKAAKKDIAKIEYLLADLDPKDGETPEAAKARYLAALKDSKPASTAMVDSGNGLQGLWKLADPIVLPDPAAPEWAQVVGDVEARMKAQMERLGSVAGTQNIDRILRLPGTVNIPSKAKLKAGRVACPTQLIEFNGATCRIEDFPLPKRADEQPKSGEGSAENSKAEIDWEKVESYSGWLKIVADLPMDFNAKGKIIVGHTGSIEDLNTDLKQAGLIEKPYSTWSDVSLALTSIFKFDGRFCPEQIAAALMCDLQCNRHVLKLDGHQQRRAVERLLFKANEPAAKRMSRALPWRECRANGTPVATMYNARLGLVEMGIECRHDLFRDVTIIGFRNSETVHEVKPLIGELTNSALIRLRHMFSERFGFDPEDKPILDAVKTLAFENCFDPVLDMLDAAQAAWDKTPRLDKWVVTYLKCEDTKLNRAIGRKHLIAAVRRPRSPGCKFDNITVLESPEGYNKSTAIRVLAGDQFFSDQSILGARDKEVQEQLAGIWMHESADLAGMRRADVEHIKAFASRQADRARPAYGRILESKKRRSIEWGTTNDLEYLQSQNGNRRFWPLSVGLIDIDALKRDRLQLLGEAATYEAQGESLLLDKELWPAVTEEQEQRRAKDPWEDLLASIPETVPIFKVGYCSDKRIIHHDDEKEKVKSSDILTHVLRLQEGQQNTSHAMRLAPAMKIVGWQREKHGKVVINGVSVRGYWRPRSAAPATTTTPATPTTPDEPNKGEV